VMAHAQKTDLIFRRNGRVHLNRWRASVQSTTGSRGVRISGSNARYTVFRGSVKSTGYALHSPVSSSFSGIGGLVVNMLASGTRVRGFKPGRSRWIFQASEKSSACLPSEGK
jgi:hypothetical protein